MTTTSNVKNHGLSSFVVSNPSCNQILSFLQRTFLTALLVSLIWFIGLPLGSAFATPNAAAVVPGEIASQIVDSVATEGDRMSAFIACLPKQLGQPNFKRALDEMGNDQLERIFNIKANPKLSQAEAELKSCMNRKGFTK